MSQKVDTIIVGGGQGDCHAALAVTGGQGDCHADRTDRVVCQPG